MEELTQNEPKKKGRPKGSKDKTPRIRRKREEIKQNEGI